MSLEDVPYELYDSFLESLEPADLARFAETSRANRDVVRTSRTAQRTLDSRAGPIDARVLSLVRVEGLETPIKVVGSLDRARVITHPTLRRFKVLLGLTSNERAYKNMVAKRHSGWREKPSEEEVALAQIAPCVSFLEEWLTNTNFPTFDVTVRNRDVGVRLELTDDLYMTFFAQPYWEETRYDFYELFDTPVFMELFKAHPIKTLTVAEHGIPQKNRAKEMFSEVTDLNVVCIEYGDVNFLNVASKLPLKKAILTLRNIDDGDLKVEDFRQPYEVYINDITGNLVGNMDPRNIAAIPNVKKIRVPQREYEGLKGLGLAEKLGVASNDRVWLLTPLPNKWNKELGYGNRR